MKLEEAKMKLPAYLRGALTPEESAAVEQALARETISAAEQQRLEQVDGMLRAAPAPEPPAEYFKDLAARIQSKVTGNVLAPGQERSMSSSKEDSGLIDVKKLAANTLASPEEAAPALGVSEFSQLSGRASVVGMQIAPLPPEPEQSFGATMGQSGAPMQQRSQGAPKWVWPLLGLVGVTAAGAIAVAVFALKDKPAAPVVAMNEPAAVTAPAAAPVPTVTPMPAPLPAEPAPTAEKAAAPEKAAEAAAAPADEPVAEAAAAARGKAAKGAKPVKGAKVAAAAAPAPAPAPKADAKAAAVQKAVAQATGAPAKEEKVEEKKPAKAGKGAELDNLIASALSPSKAHDDDDEPKKKEPPKAEAPKPAAADPMKVALDGLKPRAKKCFAKFNIPGMVDVRLTVGTNGSVQALTLSGDYDGTPTGACIVKELKAATFPAGATRSLSHSFKLP